MKESWLDCYEKPPRWFGVVFALVVGGLAYYWAPYALRADELLELGFGGVFSRQVELVGTSGRLDLPPAEAPTFLTPVSPVRSLPERGPILLLVGFSILAAYLLLRMSRPGPIVLYLLLGASWTATSVLLVQCAGIALPGAVLVWYLAFLALTARYVIRAEKYRRIEECLPAAIPAGVPTSRKEFQAILTANLERALGRRC